MTLDQTALGERAKILALSHTGLMRRRLQDIGLIENTVVECVGKSPMGDPRAYLVRGAVIAIRIADGKKITVEKLAREEEASWD